MSMPSMHQDMLLPVVDGRTTTSLLVSAPRPPATFDQLPPEIILKILNSLDFDDLLPCQTVSKKIRALTRMVLLDELSGLEHSTIPPFYESPFTLYRHHGWQHGHPLPMQELSNTELPPLPPNYYSTAPGAFHPYSTSSPSVINYMAPNLSQSHPRHDLGLEDENHWIYQTSRSPTMEHQQQGQSRHSRQRLSTNISVGTTSSNLFSSNKASLDANYVAPRSMALFLYPHHDHTPTGWQERQTIYLTCVDVDRIHEQLIYAPVDENASRMRFQSNTWSVPPIPLTSVSSILSRDNGSSSSSISHTESGRHGHTFARPHSPNRTRRSPNGRGHHAPSHLSPASPSSSSRPSHSSGSPLTTPLTSARSPSVGGHSVYNLASIFTSATQLSASNMATLSSNQGTKVRSFYNQPWELHRPSSDLLPLSTLTSTSAARTHHGPRIGLDLFDYETGQLREKPSSSMTSIPLNPGGTSATYPSQARSAAELVGLGFTDAHTVPHTPESGSTDPLSSNSPSMPARRRNRKSPSTSPRHKTGTPRFHATTSSSAPWATVNGSGGEHYSVIGIKHGDWPKDRIEDGRWWGGGLHTSLVQESMLLLPLSASLSFKQESDGHCTDDSCNGTPASQYDRRPIQDRSSTLSTSSTGSVHSDTAMLLGSSQDSGSLTPLSYRMSISSDEESMASLSRRSRSSSIEGPKGGISLGLARGNQSQSGNDTTSAQPPSKSETLPPQHQEQQRSVRHRSSQEMMNELRKNIVTMEYDLDDFGDGSVRARTAAILEKEERRRQRRQRQQVGRQQPATLQGHFFSDREDDESTEEGETSDDDLDSTSDSVEFHGFSKTHLHRMYLATSSPRRHPSHHLRYLCVHHDRNTMLANHHDPAATSPYVSTAESRFESFHSPIHDNSQYHSPLSPEDTTEHQPQTPPKMTKVGNRHLSVEYAAQVVETKKCSYCLARPCKANVEIQVQFGLVRVSLDWILSGFAQ
ncbi:hypothetical protein BGZ73_005803 [Actinomortierella ambigua]|nr:hypothetical protein BGZ73_005803 [Actinomortierella ambigua]